MALLRYLRANPREERIFADAMTARAHGDIAALLDVYDAGGFVTIADIGGGQGHLLQAVLTPLLDESTELEAVLLPATPFRMVADEVSRCAGGQWRSRRGRVVVELAAPIRR